MTIISNMTPAQRAEFDATVNGGNVLASDFKTGTPAATGVTSIDKLSAPASAAEHYPLGLTGQEQTVWTANGKWYNLFTGPFASLGLMEAPIGADIKSAAIFYGQIAGTVLTVSEPLNGASPKMGSIIKPGMTLQSGAGAKVLAYGTNGTTGRGGTGTYALSAAPGDVALPQRLTANWWSVPQAVLGLGAAGVPGNAAHAFVYQEGANLYLYWIATSTAGGYTVNNTYVATGSVSDPYTWTPRTTPVLGPVGNGNAQGNVGVYKSNGIYYLFQEALAQTTFPVEGVTNSWQIFLATSTTPTDPFTGLKGPLESLRPTPNASVSHVRIYPGDNGTFVAYYHVGTWGRMWPNDGFRAVTTDLSADAWEITNNRSPFLRRRHVYEYDQIADLSFVKAPSGEAYVFYTAADNRSSTFNIMVVPMAGRPQPFDAAGWSPTASGNDPMPVPEAGTVWNHAVNIAAPTSKYGSWVPTVVAGAQVGSSLVSAGNQNDFIVYDIGGLSPGRYRLNLNYNTGPNGGIVTPQLGDGSGGFPLNLKTASNALTWSEDLTNAVWAKVNTSASFDSAVLGPNGDLGASLITSTAGGAARVNQSIVPATNQPYTISAKFKAGTANGYLAFVQNGSVVAYVTINPTTGAASSSTGAQYKIGPAEPNGWRKVTLSVFNTAAGSLFFVAGVQDGTGTSGGYPNISATNQTVYVTEMQMENSSLPTSYAKKTSATIDTYSASAGQNVDYPITFDILGTETFLHPIKLLMASKNASSSAYALSLNRLSLQRLVQ